jgi:hypothetical protein
VIREKLAKQRDQVREELEQAADKEYPAHDIAGSFSLGVFITALPTLGTGVLVFLVLAFLFARIHKIALFASVIILNPVVKWGVYGASFSLGTVLLGPIPGVTSVNSFSLSMGPDVIARLVLGNTILAIVFAVIGYVFALRIVKEYRQRAEGSASFSSIMDI